MVECERVNIPRSVKPQKNPRVATHQTPRYTCAYDCADILYIIPSEFRLIKLFSIDHIAKNCDSWHVYEYYACSTVGCRR